LLQIEREFPLPPEALAWGYCPVCPSNGKASSEWLLAAAKRELLQEYTELFARCEIEASFTLAAIARAALCPQSSVRDYLVLDLGRTQSELAAFEQGTLCAARVLPWGSDRLSAAARAPLATADVGKGPALLSASAVPAVAPPTDEENHGFHVEAQQLALLLKEQTSGQTLFLTGEGTGSEAFLDTLRRELAGRLHCKQLLVAHGPGRSAGTLGLQKLWAEGDAQVPLLFRIDDTSAREVRSAATVPRWALVAAALLCACLALRYGEAVVRQPRLASQIAQLRGQRSGLPSIDRELNFLQFLETNQPPFLDTLFLIANAAPDSARLDTLSMSRRGDFSLRGSMAQPEQATEFRRKLVDSGYFTSVVLDEQAPTPDRQKITFRLTVQVKDAAERPPLPPPATPSSSSKGSSPLAGPRKPPSTS
jgi:hypothetical protein